jgi:hypothetical protein
MENELYLLYGLTGLDRFSAVEGHPGFSPEVSNNREDRQEP